MHLSVLQRLDGKNISHTDLEEKGGRKRDRGWTLATSVFSAGKPQGLTLDLSLAEPQCPGALCMSRGRVRPAGMARFNSRLGHRPGLQA